MAYPSQTQPITEGGQGEKLETGTSGGSEEFRSLAAPIHLLLTLPGTLSKDITAFRRLSPPTSAIKEMPQRLMCRLI